VILTTGPLLDLGERCAPASLLSVLRFCFHLECELSTVDCSL